MIFKHKNILLIITNAKCLENYNIVCHNSRHQVVHTINLEPQSLSGYETIGDIVIPTLHKELSILKWPGYGLFAQHEPIYKHTLLNDINYQRNADGALTLDCEDHNCQWRAVITPVIKAETCVICEIDLEDSNRVYPTCFHSSFCKTCYPQLKKCPLCSKTFNHK